MKQTLAIRQRLKQRKHMIQLVDDIEKDIEESKRIVERYKKTIKELNFELLQWDQFTKNH